MRKFFALLLSLSLLFGATRNASAQENSLAFARLYPADISAFPKISALLDVFDARRVFVSGLKPNAVTVYEDGQPFPVEELVEQSAPLHLVLAVNQGLPLDTRDSTGATSHFQRAAQILVQWAQNRPADVLDDYSIVSQAGPALNHAKAADFIVGLNGFKPDFRAATPNLLSLSIALDTVGAQMPQAGMKRAILFITPHSEDPNIAAALEPFIQRAIKNNVHIFVWFVDAGKTFTTTSAAAFNNLATQTGGSMFMYSGLERFPDPEVHFSALRKVYALSYTSRLKVAGEHSLRVKATLPAGPLATPEQKFSVDIQPPNPFPLTNDLNITRRAPAADPFNTEMLLPATQEIEIIVEFPDGHKRPLTRTTLYVDGAIVDENTAEPFLKFTWNLSAYANSGEHRIMVKAVDALGLSKQSVLFPVAVTVIQPPRGISGTLAKYRAPITFGAIMLAGLVLFLILLSGRLRIPTLRAAQAARRADADPLTQSVNAVEEAAPTEKNKKRRFFSKKEATTPTSKLGATATFIRMNADGQPAASAPIQITEKESAYGTDPVQCTQILADPSISSVHARLRQTDDGGYLLQDSNSLAGTWVNYEPVPREGCRLAHGDMVHFGQLIYRFALKPPPAPSKPKITFRDFEE